MSFTRISAPKSKDLVSHAIKTSSELLESVHPKIAAYFIDDAKKLVEKFGAENLVARALAKLSNFTSISEG